MTQRMEHYTIHIRIKADFNAVGRRRVWWPAGSSRTSAAADPKPAADHIQTPETDPE